MRWIASIIVAALSLGAGLIAQDVKPPSKRESKELFAEWKTLDPRDDEQFLREQEILTQLDRIPLKKIGERTWRKDLNKWQTQEQRKLPTKSRSYYFWEKEKKALFLIGGETKKPKGLLIGMHGGGVGSGDPSGIHGTISTAGSALDLLAISPGVLEKTERGWTDSGTEEWVIDLVDAAIRTWDINPARIYFSGHSMGGYGSWTLGAHHADRVAGLGPSAGAPSPIYNFDGEVIDLDSGVIPNLRNVPMVVFQSVDDPRVPPDVNQAAAKFVAAAKEKWGGYENFRYWEVDGFGHGYPEGGLQAVVRPLTAFERNPVPERIVWQPALDWKRQFYWLWWEKPINEAIVIADLDRESNAVHLASESSLAGMRILLDDRVLDLAEEVLLYVNGEEVARAMVSPTVGDLLRTARTPDAALHFHASLTVPATDAGTQ
ncbi:MAG: hypothetical protein MK209_09830 [Planctomycetes bacterium]|nr:hypothetical protein [Planctomycetota bacterium]